MARYRHSLRFTILSAALTLGFAVNASLPVQAQGFRPPRSSGPGAPDNTEAGATRGDCIAESNANSNFVALVPASKVGETVAEYPTVYWYMPRSTAEAVEFVLRDANSQPIYSVKYPLAKHLEKASNGTDDDSIVTGSPGYMSLTVPASAAPPLEIGKVYQWDLNVICDSYNNSTAHMSGGFKRVKLNSMLERRLQQASADERIALYRQYNLWYEAVGTMVELQRQRPNDQNLAAVWDKFLNADGY